MWAMILKLVKHEDICTSSFPPSLSLSLSPLASILILHNIKLIVCQATIFSRPGAPYPERQIQSAETTFVQKAKLSKFTLYKKKLLILLTKLSSMYTLCINVWSWCC